MPVGRVGPRAGTKQRQKPRSPLSRRLIAARLQAGVTQQELADQIGASQRVIAHWETESVALRADQLAALADALGITTDYLLGREDKGKTRAQSHPGHGAKARQVFEEVSTLPRSQQQRILDVVQDMLAARRLTKADS